VDRAEAGGIEAIRDGTGEALGKLEDGKEFSVEDSHQSPLIVLLCHHLRQA